jgi:Flp pilus assembly protein TadG
MNRSQSRGSISVEAVLLTPVLVMLVLLVVHVSRLTEASIQVHRAADVGARAASLSSASQMMQRGVSAAQTNLLDSQSSCTQVRVQIARGNIQQFATVTTTVSCVVNSKGLGLLSLPSRTVTASSTEVIDYYTRR